MMLGGNVVDFSVTTVPVLFKRRFPVLVGTESGLSLVSSLLPSGGRAALSLLLAVASAVRTLLAQSTLLNALALLVSSWSFTSGTV